jgi:fibronectin-binding autotransporter adhesin
MDSGVSGGVSKVRSVTHRRFFTGVSCAALALSLSLPAAAQNWTGTTSTDWTDGTNWDSGVVPTSPSSVTIDGGLPSILGVSGAATGSSGALSIGIAGVGSLAIQNGSSFTSNGVTQLADLAGSTGVLNVTGPGSLFNQASGLLVLGNQGAGALHILNGGTVRAADGVRLGTAGSSGGALSITNGGTLETTALLAGASGAKQVYVENGTLRALSNNSAWVSGFTGTEINIEVGGLTLDSNGFTVGVQSPLSGIGSLTKTGAGTVVLSAFNSYTGETVIQSGTLMLTNSASLAMSSGVVVDGTFDISGITAAGTDIVFLAGSGAVVLGTKTLTIANASSIFSGSITGSGALAISGGTQILTGTNTYTGGTMIAFGSALRIGDGGTSGSIIGNVANAGTLIFNRSDDISFSGNISSAGSVTKLGAGSLVLSGFNTYSGGTLVTAGVLQAGSADAIGSGTLTLNGGTFRAGTSFTNAFANPIRLGGAGGTIDVNGQVMLLSGDISDSGGGGGGLAFVNSDSDIGAAELSGNNSYSVQTAVGDRVTLIAASDTAFSPNSDVALATTGALLANGHNVTVRSLSGGGAVGNGDTSAGSLTIALPSGWASYAGVIMDGEPGDAPLALVKTGAGTQTLTGTNTYTGGTTITGGVLQIGDGGTSGSITGDVVNNSTLSFNRSDTLVFAGAISGTGDVQKHHGTGTLRLTGVNSYSGGTLIAGGTLIGSATSFGSGGITNLGTLVIDQPVNAAFANAISGTGTFTKRGAGNLNLTGTSTLSGQTTVEAGMLSVNGSLANSAVTVLSGAALGGNGTIGSTTIQSGGTIAPGNSIGTLNVNGNLMLAPGSLYEVEIAGNGTSDRIAASGIATVTGSQVGVSALDPQTSYINGQRYTIITAAGGVSGTVAGAVSRSAFLDLTVDHRPNQVDLVIALKGTPPVTPPDPGTPPVTPPVVSPPPPSPAIFGTVAQTRNQFATAGGLDTLPQAGGTLALYNSLLMLDAPSARQAFDALSGEIHASAKSAMVDESWLLRAAVNDRLRSAFGAVGASPMATLNYGFSADLAPSATGPMPRLRSDRFAVWGQGYGSWGRTDSDGNAAKLTRSTGGFLIGADVAVVDSMRLGVVAGYSRSEFDVNGRLSSGESDNYHLGLYGGGQWGALGLRLGASYTWHAIETRRTAGFAGFGDRLKAGYDAGTAQVFGEVGYRIDLGKLALEPFAGLAYVNLHTDGFSETGGVAALTARSDDTSLGYSTLGLRASTTLALQGMDLTLRGGLAWRHAFGDVTPTAALAFAGASSFTVAGLPIAKDAAVVEAGLDLAISKSAALGLAYTGQLAQDTQDHAFKGTLAVRF